MSQRHHKKPAHLQYGTQSRVNSRPSFIQEDFGVNLNKLFSSWFGGKDFLSFGSKVENGNITNIPTLINGNKTGRKNKDTKSRHKSTRNERTTFYIDLNKLDAIPLNSSEKKKIKHLLTHLKCENINERVSSKCLGLTEIVGKTSVTKKVSNKSTITKVNSITLKQPVLRSKEIVTNNQRKFTKQTRKNTECMYNSTIAIENKKPPKRKQRRRTTITTLPQLEVHHSEINSQSCGDTLRPICEVQKRCSSTTSTVLGGKKKISIQSIEFKYINPTYIVQYNTNSDESVPKRNLFSNIALDAHLGHRACPEFKRNRETGPKTYMHYEVYPPRLIGIGSGTERMIREQGPSVSEMTRRSDFRHKLPSDVDEPTIRQRDPAPYSLEHPEHRVKLPSVEELPVKKKRGSKCKIILKCLRKCLCLSERSDSKSVLVRGRSPRRKINEEDYYRITKNINSEVKSGSETRITRTTKEEFTKPKTEQNQDKVKQKHSKHVSFG